jgi:signal transduction histidine kinase
MTDKDQLFAGGGEMGAIMRAMDWSKTKLGPVEEWPSSLRTMLGVVLGSRFPMLLWWGPDLLHLYNDAYRPILRDKHPAALAAPAAQVWAEVWDVAGPMARSVQEGGPATWTEDLQLFINSGGMAEETYFTFSYSPVPGDDGRVGGLLNTVQETTAKVQSERQVRMLHDLAVRASEAESEDEAYRVVVDVLSANDLDLPFVLLYILNESGDDARLVGRSGLKDDTDASATCWPFAEVVRTAHELVVGDLAGRLGPLPPGRWNARPEQAIVLPLSHSAPSKPHGFLVAGISPHRALEDRYRRFFRATAAQVMTVIANARAHETEKKRAEALVALDRAKTAFFSNVSHEFRTPLTLMLGPLEDGLADALEPLGPHQRARLELAHQNALRLLKLVNALLDFSRLEAGRMQATYAPLDIAGFAAELAAMFQSAAHKAGVRLVIDCPRLLAPAWVDRDMWEKIVTNLISNAFKFTLAGEIAVRVREEPARVLLEVADTGVGIPELELPRVFDRFYRVSGASGRTHEGTGIGLSLVRELVEQHGGRVAVESEVGRGTTFRVEIPTGYSHLPSDAVSQKPADPHTGRDAAAHAAEATRWAGASRAEGRDPEAAPAKTESARVLVVDDNADLRQYLSGLLSPTYDVATATDGLAALEAVRARMPDIVVSDVMMPGLDGFGLLRALRADASTASLPVILLSARAGEESAIEGLDAGSDDYVVKPFSARELLARVRSHLELARARRAWITELESANRELDAFSYSVSHDLRAPLRAIDGFSEALRQHCAASLDEEGRRYLERVRAATRRMAELIEDLLGLARISRRELSRQAIDLSAIAEGVAADLAGRQAGRPVQVVVEKGLTATADRGLVTVLLENLMGNAWKFSGRKDDPRIEVGRLDGGTGAFYVRDNGAGFDMAYADKLFGPFQRLHSDADFEGTGIGLATVQRIVSRHGGRVWAEGEVGKGATFFFTLKGAAL